MFAKVAVAALAVLGHASAQSTTASATQPSACKASGTTTVDAAAATALASQCTVYSGSIAISPSVAGELTLSGLQQIQGGLSCIGASNLTGLYAPQLNAIGGAFDLEQLTIMSTLSFPSLTSVGSIKWLVLNALQTLTFTAGVTKAGSVEISDTQLTTLNGINLATVGNFDINNNNFLRTISTQVSSVTGLFSLSANGPNLNVSLPNLLTAQNISIANVTGLTIPSLRNVTSSFYLLSNYFTSVMAPNLTLVGNLAINANPSLTNVSMPALATISAGSLAINNNTLLSTIDGFTGLKSVGAISISGNFSSLSLPSLQDDKGALYLDTSGSLDCSKFTSLSTQIVKGKITCISNAANVQNGGTSGTGGNAASGSAAASTSKSSAGGIDMDMTAIYGMFSLAAIFTTIGGAAGIARLLL